MAKHHFIPEFYLRPWCSVGDHKLEEFGRAYRGQIKSRRRGPASTGFMHDLYAVPGVSPDLREAIEKRFMQMVDTQAARIRDTMLAGRVPSNQRDRYIWARFMVALFLRSPEEIAKFKHQVALTFRNFDAELKDQYAEVRGPADPMTYEEYVAATDPTSDERNALLIAMDLMQQRSVIKLIIEMDWRVLDVSRVRKRFMTSDRPYVITNGLGRPDGHLALPISPTKLFLGSMLRDFGDVIAKMPTRQIVVNVNDAVIGQAREKVYGVDASEIATVRKRMTKRDYLSFLPATDDEPPSIIDMIARRRASIAAHAAARTGPISEAMSE